MPIIDSETTIGLDPYGLASMHLSQAARDTLDNLRAVLAEEVGPLMPRAWESASMPPSVRETLASLDLMRPEGVEEVEADSSMFSGIRNYVLARTDVSVATM
ncbi:hypothetical protein ABH903_001862 [Brevibacterium epidermidis]|jgi:glutaryl-CoA dehydrogenase|uniref:Uncharacterized protein n=2 Tax=Brevibacterium epidermidis TaxID=1698 RepID=A0ABV4EK92_BREEP